MYIALFLNPRIALNIKISETILLPPLVGAKYTKLLFPSITAWEVDKHWAYQGKSLLIPVCFVNYSQIPSGNPQYSSLSGS